MLDFLFYFESSILSDVLSSFILGRLLFSLFMTVSCYVVMLADD